MQTSTPPRRPNPYADRARRARQIRAHLTTSTRPTVDEVFAHVDDDAGIFGADQRPSTWMRADSVGGAS